MNLLINEYPLQVLPSLAKEIGLVEAMFLQQLHYWLNRSAHNFEGRKWVYNTAAGWKGQFDFVSEKTIRRAILKLEKLQLIEKTNRFNQRKYDKTNWFSINYGKVSQLSEQFKPEPSGQSDQTVDKATGQNVQMHVDKMSRPIPETTRDKKLQHKKPAAANSKNKIISDHAWFTAWWCFVCESIDGAKYPYKQKDAGQVKQLLKLHDLTELLCRSCVYLTLPSEQRFPRGARTIGGLLQQIAEVHSFNDELMDRFIKFGYLPDDSQSGGVTLKSFQPWKDSHVTSAAS